MPIKKFLRPPYLLLIILSVVMLVNSFLGHGSMDFDTHDSYLIIDSFHTYAAFAVILLGTWIIYITADKLLPSRILAALHIYSLVVYFGVGLLFDWIGWPHHKPSGKPVTYYDANKLTGSWDEILGIFIVLLFLLGWLSFIVNFIAGVVRLAKRFFNKSGA